MPGPGPYVVGDNVTFDVTDIRLRRVQGFYNFTATIQFFKTGSSQSFLELKVQSDDYSGNVSAETQQAIDAATVEAMTWLADRF